MQRTVEECPLFTSRHAHHSAVWTIPGFSVPKLCIACATERLEDKGELSVHLKKVLGELRALLGASGSTSSLLNTLSSDKRIIEHLCSLLFGRTLSHFSTCNLIKICSCTPFICSCILHLPASLL